MNLESYKNDYTKAEHLQKILIDEATGYITDNEKHQACEQEYKELRRYFLDHYEAKIPKFLKTKRDLFQFWNFIKHEFSSYRERREYIWNSFSALLNYTEQQNTNSVSRYLSNNEINIDIINSEIQKGLKRVRDDPEGAITIGRTILESTCKFISDKLEIQYEENITLPAIYKNISKKLNLSPAQHTESIFKQILGGCSSIVNGLGTLRNKLGDAHGKGIKKVKPSSRHAELAVNIAGSMSIFLIKTYLNKKAEKPC